MKSRAFIEQMRPSFGEEEAQAVASYMREGGYFTEFHKTTEFEKRIAGFTSVKHCIVVNNGTVSLSLAALAAGLRAGDEVIVPNYTMIATPNSVKMFGMQPVFVDVEASTLCLDIKAVEQAITPNTRAIMLVTANGRYPESGVVLFEQLARRHGLVLIEDAAQSLGSFYPDGRHMGTAGLVGSISFSAPKIISTGQGGCLLTDDDQTAEKLRKLKDFGRVRGGIDEHDELGLNFKFTDLQACVGIEQMKKLPWRVERKKEIYRRYAEQLAGVPGVELFEHDLECTTPWFIDSRVERRDALMAHLKERGVGTRVMYPPINRQPCYALPGDYPVSESIGSNGLWLPSASQLENEEIDYVCEQISAFYG